MAYFFLDRFGLPPDVTARQDEAIMQDLMLMDRQVNYRKWSRAHGLIEDEDLAEEVIEKAKAALGMF
jgi:hypothetical protein